MARGPPSRKPRLVPLRPNECKSAANDLRKPTFLTASGRAGNHRSSGQAAICGLGGRGWGYPPSLYPKRNATHNAEWDRPDADQGPYASAMAAIETFRPGTRTGSLAPWRAGGLEGNHRTHSSFMPPKSSSSARITVALTIFSSELPASCRMAAMLVRHCRVCSWMVAPTNPPVTGSAGGVPDEHKARGLYCLAVGCGWLGRLRCKDNLPTHWISEISVVNGPARPAPPDERGALERSRAAA